MKAARKLITIVAVFSGVFLLCFAIYYPFSPLGRQRANLKKAELHLAEVRDALQQVSFASNLNAAVFTGAGGAIRIEGDLPNDEKANSMINSLQALNLPVTLDFALVIGQTNLLRKTISR